MLVLFFSESLTANWKLCKLQNFTMKQYITKQGEDSIRAFKYRGGSVSLSYEYLWSPLAQYLLRFIPLSWAPNSITIAGFLINAIGSIAIAVQTPHDQPALPWTLIFYGICVLTYQTLDNIDGKHARRLKNSSPLGMIMDHGCDALGLIFLSLGVARVICLNNPSLFLWVYSFGVTFSFYISAWCQYYSNGIMILGKVNAVDDGIPVIAFLGILSGLFGQSIWRHQLTLFSHTLPLCDLIALAIMFSGFIQIYSIIHQSGSQFTKDYKRAFGDLLHLLCLLTSIYFITFHSELATHHFISIVLALGFTMSRTISYTLVCTVAGMRFKQFHFSVLLFTFAYPFYIFIGKNFINEWLFMWGIALIIMVEYFYFVTSVANQIAKALGIRVLHVFKPKN